MRGSETAFRILNRPAQVKTAAGLGRSIARALTSTGRVTNAPKNYLRDRFTRQAWRVDPLTMQRPIDAATGYSPYRKLPRADRSRANMREGSATGSDLDYAAPNVRRFGRPVTGGTPNSPKMRPLVDNPVAILMRLLGDVNRFIFGRQHKLVRNAAAATAAGTGAVQSYSAAHSALRDAARPYIENNYLTPEQVDDVADTFATQSMRQIPRAVFDLARGRATELDRTMLSYVADRALASAGSQMSSPASWAVNAPGTAVKSLAGLVGGDSELPDVSKLRARDIKGSVILGGLARAAKGTLATDSGAAAVKDIAAGLGTDAAVLTAANQAKRTGKNLLRKAFTGED